MKKLTLTSPTSGGRSVGIVRSRTQTTELLLVIIKLKHLFSLGTLWKKVIYPYFASIQLILIQIRIFVVCDIG
jgi:hypothetical protein